MRYKLISHFQNVDINSKEVDNSKATSNNDSINSDNFEDSESIIFIENSKDEETEINNLNLLFKDSRKFLFENEPRNIKSSMINKDNNGDDYDNIIEKDTISNRKNIKNIDNISLDLLNRNFK